MLGGDVGAVDGGDTAWQQRSDHRILRSQRGACSGHICLIGNIECLLLATNRFAQGREESDPNLHMRHLSAIPTAPLVVVRAWCDHGYSRRSRLYGAMVAPCLPR